MNLNDIFAGVNSRTYIPAKKPKLIPILTNQMSEESKKAYPPAKEATFRASGVGGCQRKMMYKLLGYEEQLDHVSVFTLEQGTLIHEMIQGYLQRAGIIQSLEEELNILPNLNGHYDGVIVINNARYVLEIKTINAAAYERMVKYGSVYKKYLLQAHCYMKALGINKTIFLFVNKNHLISDECKQEVPSADPLFHEIEIDFDKTIWQEVSDKIGELTEYFDKKVMPPMKKVSECAYCNFQNKCQLDWEQEKNKNKSKPKAPVKRTKKAQQSSESKE